MRKALHRLITATFIVFIIQLIVLVGFGIFYYQNFFNFRDYISIELIYIVAAVLIAFDIIALWTGIIVFNSVRHKANIKAADLIGADVQEAYNFGMISMAIIDENNKVIWVNDLFRDRHIDILDLDIFEWQPKLADLVNASSDAKVKIEINSRSYEVKLLQDAGLFIFRDITEYETIYDFSKRQAAVIGFIMIDNYSDISGSTDDSNDVITKVRQTIFDYSKEYGVLIRRYRNDSYFAVCNYESLEKMRKDKFSILEKIHQIGEKEETPPTLSIGFAHDFPDVVKLSEMAENAIEIAMSRGGDQVVVSRYGEDIEFFGGKSEAQENRNKVKVRVMADSVLSLIRNSSNILIMGHAMTDMDSLGSCLGMKAICDYVKKTSQIVYDQRNTEKKARGAMVSSFSREELAKITISPSDALSALKPNTLVIVCDVHRPSMTLEPKLLEKATKTMVIDHHRRSEEFIDSPVFSYIEPSASSASEMVAELIHYSSANPRIVIPSAYATIMLSGIFMDSNSFKAKTTGIRTFEASMILKEDGADNSVADDFLKDEFEEYTLITKIISTLRTPFYGVVYCVADDEDIIEAATLAKVGNQCLQMKGVNACFVIGKTNTNEVRISCRSDGTINVQLIAEKLNGGGHYTQAASAFKNVTIEHVESKLLDILSEYLNDARSVPERK